jgi:hypothetical protein
VSRSNWVAPINKSQPGMERSKLGGVQPPILSAAGTG